MRLNRLPRNTTELGTIIGCFATFTKTVMIQCTLPDAEASRTKSELIQLCLCDPARLVALRAILLAKQARSSIAKHIGTTSPAVNFTRFLRLSPTKNRKLAYNIQIRLTASSPSPPSSMIPPIPLRQLQPRPPTPFSPRATSQSCPTTLPTSTSWTSRPPRLGSISQPRSIFWTTSTGMSRTTTIWPTLIGALCMKRSWVSL
jgi:hypothetical protein